MRVRIQVIKVYDLEVPEGREGDPLTWAYNLDSLFIAERGILEDVMLENAEVTETDEDD